MLLFLFFSCNFNYFEYMYFFIFLIILAYSFIILRRKTSKNRLKHLMLFVKPDVFFNLIYSFSAIIFFHLNKYVNDLFGTFQIDLNLWEFVYWTGYLKCYSNPQLHCIYAEQFFPSKLHHLFKTWLTKQINSESFSLYLRSICSLLQNLLNLTRLLSLPFSIQIRFISSITIHITQHISMNLILFWNSTSVKKSSCTHQSSNAFFFLLPLILINGSWSRL